MGNIPGRIGILTEGGDCPGLNAVLRAVTKDAIFHGIEVVGIEDGFLGLIEGRARWESSPALVHSMLDFVAMWQSPADMKRPTPFAAVV